MSWNDENSDPLDWGFGRFIGLGRVLSFGRLKPMTAFGRMDQRLRDGDYNFHQDEEHISDELLAALRRIQITSARTS